ncbi:Stk1 family PASTA domain-containing Ser/Thr kinase [Pseudoflavonifractor sp. AF19-9AC]|uniref:Stk1 family PASTA domain-containing Ser/Thr kinase n=1 Tax=Pseudoflavonifractor sp. AF19-9AC TaxID=2292244 RepID=UPI000E484061|nr:Stk1 family PASTA domain-containing Ser/Thr kinase [Pseudoflavonifractor sp. AF19-9AC]RHR11367.1 Stk1 family PASTA domain-containing Ser/Thr kinase [Pseudoflavonifractor sp. AF19-9AC]
MDQYIGKLLDNRYEILEIIGTGGMARVYKARCHRLNRLVAIKILREDLAQDAEFRRRFHDESQAVAMLSHPNIVAVYDVSRSSELEYIVMELIDGITLKQYMQKKGNKLNWREALHFTTQIVKALGHAHSRGIIHRDIKPHNVMVLRDGSVKVADFGIARVASGGHSTLTQEALGSVHYISPEQARGSHIDARSDLYSAGVVLYEMITGRLPFEGDTPVSVAIQHINSIPLSPREIDPTIPEALEAITMKAMAPNPDNRYSSADEMLADLEEFRKNPNINFDYNVSDFMPEAEPDDDKTQIRTPSSGSREARPRTHSQPRHSSGERRSSSERRSRRYEEDEEEDRRSGTSPWVIVGIVAAILLFLAGAVFFLTRVLSSTFTPAATYEVPKVVGENYESAAQDTELLGRFTLVVGETVADEEAEAGTILRQSPEAGSKVGEDVTQITVTISGGPDVIKMVDVYNMEYREAYLKLTGMGLKVANPTYEASEDVAKDHVISYNPPEGAELAPGDEVQLVVSSGPKEKTVMVPSLETMTEEKARSTIRLSNLTEGETELVYDDTVPEGYVVGQYPAANTEVPEGTTVNIQVSKGPDPDKQPQEVEKTITVDLPDSEGPVNVQAMMDGQVIFSETKDPTMDLTVDIPVKGKAGETKTVTIYFDGVQFTTKEVTF